MPRDVPEVRSAFETVTEAAAAPEAIPACYLCGAWADDARRCRHPRATACIQAGSRFAVRLESPAPEPWASPTPLTRH